MGQYSSFIEETIKTPGFAGGNMLQYADVGGEIYLSFQTLLRFLNEYVVMVDKNNKPIVKIDWESEKPFFAYSTSVSCNLGVCYLYNDYVGTGDGAFIQEGIPAFLPFTDFVDPTISALQEAMTKEADAKKFSIYPTIGNINYIYLNVGYLSKELFDKSNNAENKATISKYLQAICDDINKALGSINDFQVVIDEDTNSVTIIDFNQKRIKNLNASKTQTVTTLKAQGLGSFVTGISAQSNITPDIAATISIGAQVNGNELGIEATSFSRLSKGLLDRIYPQKKIPNTNKVQDIDLAKERQTQFEQTKQAYIQIIANQVETSDQKILYKSEDKINLENIPVELYKALLGKFTESNQTSTTFIPVKVDLTLSGISGVKIFQRFTLSGDVLPYTYSNNFDLIVLGVNHEVNNSGKWITKLSTLTVLKEN